MGRARGPPAGLTAPADLQSAPMPATFFPLLLVTHITLAIGLFLPSILLPFTLRTRRATVDSESRVVRGPAVGAEQRHARDRRRPGPHRAWASSPSLGPTMLEQPWLLVALTIYFVNLAIAFFIQRPNLRRLIGVKAAADDGVWKERAKRQRYVSYLMAGLVGTIGFLMSTKPALW